MMKQHTSKLAAILWVTLHCLILAQDKPNILWITSEDNDYGWLGCYGNEHAQTPNLDKLAAEGILYKKAYSNAPVCAIARSTIITGSYAVTQGTQHMRSRHAIPAKFKPYTKYLQEQGYYCSNARKTDYNFKGDDSSYWDDCSSKAHYKNRPKGAPFFSVFNLTVSHESSLFQDRIKSNRRKGIIPKTTRIAPDKVNLRPYLPDLPEIRQDIATYHDVITALDTQVGAILDQLEQDGLADNTIVLYYSDHGGVTPRGKRYLKDSGARVPMILRVPQKWQHLVSSKPGDQVNTPVSFIDLAPTLLSIAEVEKPAHMPGQAFVGKSRVEPKPNELKQVFLFADRFDEFYGMRRGITDGRWKYIRRFTPHLSAAPYSNYQFSQLGWQAWRKAWQTNQLSGRHKEIWENNQPTEELFDTQLDPWEVNNLAHDPQYTNKLEELRQSLKSKMIEVKDSGVIPESMFSALSINGHIADYVSKYPEQHREIVEIAFLASSRELKHQKFFTQKLSDKHPLIRYWATQGLLILGNKSATALESIPALKESLDDSDPSNRIAAAHTLHILGQTEIASKVIVQELEKDNDEYVKLAAMNSIFKLGEQGRLSDKWLADTVKSSHPKSYVKRLSEIIQKQRK